MSKWIYDKSPTEGLQFEATHHTTMEMVPSRTLEAKLLKDEQDHLATIKASMSDDQSEDVIGMSEERGRPDRRIRTDRRKYDRQTESEQTDADRTGRRNRIKQDADRSQTR